MVEVNCACKHGRYEKMWLNSLCVMSNAEVFAMQDSRSADWPYSQPDEHNSLQIHRILTWINKGQINKYTHIFNSGTCKQRNTLYIFTQHLCSSLIPMRSSFNTYVFILQYHVYILRSLNNPLKSTVFSP